MLTRYDVFPAFFRPLFIFLWKLFFCRHSDVGYFAEPFPLEPWSDGNEKAVKDEGIHFLMPLRITEKKEALAEAVAALKAAVSSRKNGKMQKVRESKEL